MGKFSTGTKIPLSFSVLFCRKYLLGKLFQKCTSKILNTIRKRSLSLVLDMHFNPLIIHVPYTKTSHGFWCRHQHNLDSLFQNLSSYNLVDCQEIRPPICTNNFRTTVTLLTLCSIKAWRTCRFVHHNRRGETSLITYPKVAVRKKFRFFSTSWAN